MREWSEHLRTRLAGLQLSAAREAEIIEELSQHLDQRYEELRSGGTSDADARNLAIEELLEPQALADHLRSLRQSHTARTITPGASSKHALAGLSLDVRCAARMIRKQPGFATVAILTLALGIGANTAIFSVVYGVLLKPLPFNDAERLVGVWHRAPGLNMPLLEQGPATYFTYRESGQVFEDIGLWDNEEVSITEGGEPERVQALWVTQGLLPILQVTPLLGRSFTKEDDSPGSPRRAILTHRYWQSRFGGARSVIGRLLNVDGRPCEVIGILPPSFKFLRTDTAVLLPLQLNRAEVRAGDFSYPAVARLKPGVTLEDANADMARMIPLVFDRFAMWPGLTRKMFEEAGLGPNVRPLSQEVIGDVGRVLWILVGTVGIVLLIACANVANLFLVRAEGRQQELAVRVALGASRSRLARELLAESVGLALAGGALGLLLAWAGIGLLARLAPAGLPRIDEIGIDPLVLVFTLAISVLSGVLFGLIPVLRFGTPKVGALKEGGRSASDAPGRHRGRYALAVSEIALALVLLIVAGLMTRTFIAMRQVDPGFVRPGDPDIPRLDSRRAHQGSTTNRSGVRADDPAPGTGAWRHFGGSLIIRDDGRQQRHYPDFRRRISSSRSSDASCSPFQTRGAWLFRDDGQPGDRRACDHLDRYSPGQARRGDFRKSRARVLEQSCRRPRQADQAVRGESLAGNHRCRRKRTR